MYGAEVQADIHPIAWKGFSFNNSVALVYGINKKAAYKGKQHGGEYLPLIPPAKLVSNINQEIKTSSSIFSAINARVELEYCAAQNRYLALYNTETFSPAYTLINISAGAKINYTKNNILQLQVQVNNLFDVLYQGNLSRLKYFEYYTQSPNDHSGMYNMGSNICIKIIAGF